MYRAKERGQGRCELFDAEMRARAVRRLEVESELRGALAREELALHYQPVVELGSGEIVGLEALVRWGHPRRGMLDPAEFVSIAEASGLIEPIGRWVKETACRQAAGWHALRRISARSTSRSTSRPARLSTGTSPSRCPGSSRGPASSPANLRLEITESALVEESASAIATLEELSELGVRLVLDDFGTGYSSLAYLNRFPFDALKIDRSFIEGLGVEQERTAIVEAVIGMARALSLDAIAEGVENEAQLSELRRLGCEFAQGHLFSRPLAPPQVTRADARGRLRATRECCPVGRRC